jgi:hypothetical protein
MGKGEKLSSKTIAPKFNSKNTRIDKGHDPSVNSHHRGP